MRIDCDPEILRRISTSIVKYCTEQFEILQRYYNSMVPLSADIKMNDTERDTFKKILCAIYAEKEAFKFHLPEVEMFLTWLDQKITLLESIQASQQVAADISGVPYTNESEKERLSADMPLPMTLCPDYQANFDASCFENGQYQTGRLDEPILAYRYFGSYDEITMREIERLDPPTNPDGPEAGPSEEWGSEPGGWWFTTLQSNSPEYVMRKTALRKKWGNSAEYVAEVEIPAGAIISVGVAASQENAGGTLPGGAVQIHVNECPGILDKPDLVAAEYRILGRVKRIGRTKGFFSK